VVAAVAIVTAAATVGNAGNAAIAESEAIDPIVTRRDRSLRRASLRRQWIPIAC